MLVATYLSFGVAVLAGAYLVAVAGWALLLVGAASILAGVLYTGGPRPYGYEGLGEVFVFLFFGIVAVAGSFFVQVKHLQWEAFALAVPVGLLAAAILVVNNVRDIDTDRRSGKRTLAVRLGRERTRTLYAVIVYCAYLLTPVTWLFGPLKPWVAAAVADADLRRPDRAHGPQPHRRTVAESGAGPDRDAPASVLHDAVSRAAPQPVKLTIELIRARLRAPLVSARGSSRRRELLLLTLEDAEGVVGHGEAAPLRYYDGVGIEDVRAALEDCRQVLSASDGDRLDALRPRCARLAVLPQAMAAIDLALWDLAARRAGQPVWRMLGAAASAPVAVNATIAAADRTGAAAEAAAVRASGFRCLKAKVGIGDDAGRVAAIRAAAGPEMAIRLDANGAWSVDEARAALRALEPVRIELCEEPVSGLDATAALAGPPRSRSRSMRPPGSPGPGHPGLRRGLPEGRGLRRHLWGDRSGATGPDGGLRGLSGIDARRPAGDRRGSARRRRRSPGPFLWAGDARAVRGPG